MNKRKFKVILDNIEIEDIAAKTPHDAVEIFMKKHFPEHTFYSPLAVEAPWKDPLSGVIYNIWSVGTSASGHRIWVYE